MTDPYIDLEIDRDATDKQIKTAYRQKAKEHHPDKGGNDNNIKRINRAYLILSDPNLKDKFDRGEDPDIQPIEIIAMQMLVQTFAQVLQKHLGEWHIDLIKVCKTELGNQISGIQQTAENAGKIIEKLKEVLNRLSHDDNVKEDKLGIVVETEIRSIGMEIDNGLEKVKALEYAINISDYYQFETMETNTIS